MKMDAKERGVKKRKAEEEVGCDRVNGAKSSDTDDKTRLPGCCSCCCGGRRLTCTYADDDDDWLLLISIGGGGAAAVSTAVAVSPTSQ